MPIQAEYPWLPLGISMESSALPDTMYCIGLGSCSQDDPVNMRMVLIFRHYGGDKVKVRCIVIHFLGFLVPPKASFTRNI